MFARETFKVYWHPPRQLCSRQSQPQWCCRSWASWWWCSAGPWYPPCSSGPHLRCLHSCHPCQSGIMPPQVTTPCSWVSRPVYQAHLSGDKPRVLLLELGQVADVAGVLLHQVVASWSWELVSECCSWELVSECCSCSLSCWMVSFLILLLSTVPTAILHLNVHCVCVWCV